MNCIFRIEIQSVPQWNQQTLPVCSGGYSKQKISYKPWVNSASLLRYGLKWLFTLVMVLSIKTPIMIAVSNLPLHFLFVVYRLEVEKTWAYSIHTTWLTLMSA
jgi:hypothetical protein